MCLFYRHTLYCSWSTKLKLMLHDNQYSSNLLLVALFFNNILVTPLSTDKTWLFFVRINLVVIWVLSRILPEASDNISVFDARIYQYRTMLWELRNASFLVHAFVVLNYCVLCGLSWARNTRIKYHSTEANIL